MIIDSDGASWQISHDTIDLLCQTFDDRLISGNDEPNWPPRRFHTAGLFSVRSR